MKAIVLDMYGVIVKQTGDDFVPYVQQTFPNLTPEDIYTPWFKADVGELTSLEVWEALGFQGDVEKIEKEYLDTIELKEGILPFLNEVKGKYKLAIISNDSSRWSRYLRDKFDLNKYFDVISISGDLKIQKPDKEIFLLTLEKLGVKAEDCVYIDDREGNLEAAKKVGMKPILLNSRNLCYEGMTANGFEEILSLFYELLSFNTHPCLASEEYDGWLLRFAEGYMKRANSVNVVGTSALSAEEKIAYCEEKYAKHHLPPVFKIAPMASELDKVLEKRGYSAVDKTNVMTVELTEKKTAPEKQNQKKQSTGNIKDDITVSIGEKFTEAWQYYYFTFNRVPVAAISTAKKIQAKITNPVLCATVYLNKKAVACGLGVMEQGYVGLLDIVVKEEYRGCGFGKVLCQALLEKGKENGATTGYLQVVDSNEVAKKLYRSLEFEDLYSYWYRVK